MITKKEKREIALVISSVLLVAIIGTITAVLSADKLNAVAGAAVKLNEEVPTYPGALIYLKEYCSPASGSESCNDVCREKICIPIEENCDQPAQQCLCCG